MPRQIQGSQTDFSGGEIDVDSKRADGEPTRKAACRQMANFRIMSSGTVQNRSGRRALFIEPGRVDEVLMSPGNLFYIAFGNGYLKIYDSAGALNVTLTKLGDGTTNIPWTTATVKNIVWDVADQSIYICYGDIAPLNVPQVLTFNGSTWALTTFTVASVLGFGAATSSRTPFYRISPKNITMRPSAVSGVAATLTASANYFVAGMIGTRLRYNNRQMLITGVTNPTTATVTIEENLPPAIAMNFASDVTAIFAVGDVVIGATTGSKALVVSFSAVTQMNVMYINTIGFTAENIVGPSGAAALVSLVLINPVAVTVWDEEVMNNYRGWPTSVFFDQQRLGFCNFPSVPNGIAWSAIANPTDLLPDPPGLTPINAIFEIAPRKSRVLYVIAGPESSEFAFCDNGIYYIPINVTNPLKPGSVAFNLISTDGAAANVQPRVLQEAILWINAGQTSVMSITATGAYYRPYEVRNLSTLHSHLVKTPIAIAVPTSVSQFDERYAYFLNTDGTITCGAYRIENGQIKGIVGWVPFNGAGTVTWLSARLGNLLMTTNYSPNGITPVGIVEQLDETVYLDSAMLVNVIPAALTPPGGKGPLWYLPSGAVTLMDQVTRNMGTYQIDANGFIVPQFNGGEDLTRASLVAGQPWTAVLEPFAPEAQSGADVHQRTKTRQMSMFAPWVINSTGFLLAMLFSQKQSQTTPALGTIMNQRRVPDHNTGEDATLAPILRETVEIYTPPGSSYDPRAAIIKDTPGPLLVAEIAMEVTI